MAYAASAATSVIQGRAWGQACDNMGLLRRQGRWRSKGGPKRLQEASHACYNRTSDGKHSYLTVAVPPPTLGPRFVSTHHKLLYEHA